MVTSVYYLGLHVVRNGSVAIFCGRKDSVTKICSRAVEIVDRGVALEWPSEPRNATEVEKIRELCELELGAGASRPAPRHLGYSPITPTRRTASDSRSNTL